MPQDKIEHQSRRVRADLKGGWSFSDFWASELIRLH